MTNLSCARRRAATTAVLFGLLSCIAATASVRASAGTVEPAERHKLPARLSPATVHDGGARPVFSPIPSSFAA
ncbi:hypothetical protein [Sphingomonas humi]|uniref:Uncharacterized protein n=1 Tax=Sphingomonas humi TaxID=335630 RepID=A0ABP7SED9_9SPHN